MKSEQINFKNKQGNTLSARFDLPDTTPSAYALAAHCFTCSKDIPAMHRISKALVARGIGVFRFDFTGLGASEGDFEDSHFSANLDDIRSAVSYLTEHAASPQIMFGHSLGGTAVLATAHEVSSVKIVATIGSPFEPVHAGHFFESVADTLNTCGVANVTLAGREFTITKEFVDQLKLHDMKKSLQKLKAQLMIFHDPKDELVEAENARDIYEHANHPKSFISLPGAGHMLSKTEDAEYVSDILAAAAHNYLR